MDYVAGSCNIGKGEIRRRQFVALIGLILIITTSAGLIGSDSAKSARFSVFVPALVFSIGFIQSRRKFCLAYGLMGTFNFQKLGSVTKVEDKAALAADRKMAFQIIIQSLGLALILTSIVALVNSL